MQVTTVLAIIVGNRANRPSEEQSLGGGGLLQQLDPLLCTRKRWPETLEMIEEREGLAWEGSQGE